MFRKFLCALLLVAFAGFTYADGSYRSVYASDNVQQLRQPGLSRTLVALYPLPSDRRILLTVPYAPLNELHAVNDAAPPYLILRRSVKTWIIVLLCVAGLTGVFVTASQ